MAVPFPSQTAPLCDVSLIPNALHSQGHSHFTDENLRPYVSESKISDAGAMARAHSCRHPASRPSVLGGPQEREHDFLSMCCLM